MDEQMMIVSSDGHVGADMEDYRDYLDSRHHQAFEEYARVYSELAGGRSTDYGPMSRKVLPDELAAWKRDFLDTGRLDGYSDPNRRCVELDREGVAGEVLFPDFGVPFGPFPASAASWLDRSWDWSVEQIVAGFRAYNRWLVDFCSAAPRRLFGQAGVVFRDPDEAVREIHWAQANDMVGISSSS